MAEPISVENVGNGKPNIQILNERIFPKFLESARNEKSVNKNGSRLKLFSGSANPALSQVSIVYSVYFESMIMLKIFQDA